MYVYLFVFLTSSIVIQLAMSWLRDEMPDNQVVGCSGSAYTCWWQKVLWVLLDNQAPVHTGCGKMHTITPWVTELEEASLIYEEGTQDPETISDLFKVK